MASVTLQVRDVFPPTTSVGAYKRSNWTSTSVPQLGVAAPGSTDTTATVASDGTLTLSGLVGNTEYVAGAQVNGTWTFLNFRSGSSTYGLLADRPAIGATVDGTTFFATDDVGGTMYQAQNGAWVTIGGHGQELGSASSTTLALTLSAAFQSIVAKTVTVRDRPIEIWGIVPATAITAGTGRVQLNLIDETATQLQFVESQPIASSNQGGSMSIYWRGAPSAGSHTYTLQGRYVAATTGTMSSAATFPAQLVIKEV